MTLVRRRSLASPLPVLAVVLAAAVVLFAAGCAPKAEYRTGADARFQGVWWTGQGAFAVVQLTGADGAPVVLAWDRRVGKTIQPLTGYRVVAVEQAAPRVWLEPETGLTKAPSKYAGADLAGDALDSPPQRLLLWDIAKPLDPPTDEAEARWRPWAGPGGYTAYLEIDVLKGALPSRLLFQPSSGLTEGSKAAVPKDVSTFEPVGWSPSGKRFAVVAAGGSSARLLVFSAGDGTLETSQTLDPTRPHAAWVDGTDTVSWIGPPGGVMTYAMGDASAMPFAPASSYAPAEDSLLLGSVPAGLLVWQRAGEARGVWVLGDPVAGGVSSSVLDGELGRVAYDPAAGLAVLENDPPLLKTGAVGETPATAWEAAR